MRQLPLPISAAAKPSLDNYVAGANAEALEHVRSLARGELKEAVVYLWGETGSGRTPSPARGSERQPGARDRR